MQEKADQHSRLVVRSASIVALASGSGRAGVAVVRVSGPKAGDVVRHLSRTERLPPPRQMSLRRLYGSGDMPLDDALIVWMPSPRSYTGEDVAELHLHGSVAVVEAVMSAILSIEGCRRADPGEFTRRAVENGKLDLSRAEGLADLIEAETEHQRRAAFRLYDGDAERIFARWRDQLIEACAALEAGIDFADEADIGDHITADAATAIATVHGALVAALADADRARALRSGYRVAVVGRPNVGKSSLVNALAGRDAAMVSDVPGTTRDVVEVRLILAGFPVWIADTAGRRRAVDALEVQGVERAGRAARQADLRLWVTDASNRSADEVLSEAEESDFVVINKIDLADSVLSAGPGVFHTSMRTGVGLERLCEALAARVSSDIGGEVSPLSAHRRHCEILVLASDRMKRADQALSEGGGELAAEELRLAVADLGRLTGDIGVEDWLERIFARFCIGK